MEFESRLFAGAGWEYRYVDGGVASIGAGDLRHPDSNLAALRAQAHRLPSDRAEGVQGHG